ncbi:MAG TPA: hypothetical protein VIL31_00730 [Cyclobacteriaceae bacterium]
MAEIKEGKGNRTVREDAIVHDHSELLSRMWGLVRLLEPHQRNYHLSHRINIYWYIQKHKEIELLLMRLARQPNAQLSQYLHQLCHTISHKIDEDERVAAEFLNGKCTAK